MGAVAAYDLLKHYEDFTQTNIAVLAVGFVTSFIVAYLTIKLFLKFLERFTFVSFGVYRIVFGVALLLIFN
jgi:undecaprenyl-diphosphatase